MMSTIIFDLDGTVLDNEPEWEMAFREVMKVNNLKIEGFKLANGWYHEPGIGILPNWKRYFRSDSQQAEKLAKETVAEYWKTAKNLDNIVVRDGVDEVVAKAKERGWFTALCTGSSWNVVEPELEQLMLYLDFDVTTTGEEVLLEKPDPEIYLLTAQKLGIEPKECLVVEDAIAGVRAGVEAGMRVAAIESDYAPNAELKAAGAKWVVENLTKLLETDLMGL